MWPRTRRIPLRYMPTNWILKCWVPSSTYPIIPKTQISIPFWSRDPWNSIQKDRRMRKAGNDVAIEKVDTEIYTIWVQGQLVFRNTPFRKIRQALERKYNVTIKNRNTDLDEQLFDATFDIETIEEVLESFNKSYAIDYKIEDNEVIIQ